MNDKTKAKVLEYINDIQSNPASFELHKEETPTLKAGREYILTKHESFDLSEYISITSSNISKIGYSNDNTLLVEFNNGTEYTYANVPKEEFDKLKDAESVGSTLNKSIKNKYTCKKVEK